MAVYSTVRSRISSIFCPPRPIVAIGSTPNCMEITAILFNKCVYSHLSAGTKQAVRGLIMASCTRRQYDKDFMCEFYKINEGRELKLYSLVSFGH